jgi:hypothetical protein
MEMEFRVLHGWKTQTSMNGIKTYMDGVLYREGRRRAGKIDNMMAAALQKRFIGRIIVKLVNNKWMKFASLLSKLVGLELRDYRDASVLATKFEVVYRAKVISSMTVSDYERVTRQSSTFAL